jgi:lysyl-tRNA synthetase class 2
MLNSEGKLINGLQDDNDKIKKRYLDLIVNPQTNKIFRTKARIFKLIRNFLDDMDFVEVQTPIISNNANGAIAKPFTTKHMDLDQMMYLRIAPELYLKKLVIGGLHKVYEIGAQFRNETIDSTHNPEFYSLELYMAFVDYYDMMYICEKLISKLVLDLHNSHKISYTKNNIIDNIINTVDNNIIIDFTPPYKVINIVDTLEKMIGVKFPQDFNNNETMKICLDICEKHKIICSEPRILSRLFDKIIGHFIEPLCVNPTFLINHPIFMSPLAKNHRNNKNLSERFELFVNGFELANSYTELNDPKVQLEIFNKQMEIKSDSESDEIPEPDHSYIEALEYGLPPTCGFGLGLERLTMILTNSNTIKDVILFPGQKKY